MAITNAIRFQGNYWDGNINDSYSISLSIKNENTFDLHLRLGFSNSTGTKIVMTTPIIIPPSIGEWQYVSDIIIASQEYTILEGPGSIQDVLSAPSELRIIHNENISFNGAYENGSFEIDNIGTLYLLNVNDFKYKPLKVHPNPITDILHIESGNLGLNKITIYNLLGEQKNIPYNGFNKIDLSNLASGVYLLKKELL